MCRLTNKIIKSVVTLALSAIEYTIKAAIKAVVAATKENVMVTMLSVFLHLCVWLGKESRSVKTSDKKGPQNKYKFTPKDVELLLHKVQQWRENPVTVDQDFHN